MPAAIKRVSWGAIFAGTVVAVVVQLMLNALGVGFGMSALDPTAANPFSGLGLGTILWLIISTLIALFAGGWVAGRLAGIPRRADGAIHGFIAWGLATLVTLYLITSAVTTVVGGAFGLAGQGLQAAGQVAGQGVAAAAPEARQVLQEQGVTLESIKQEAQQLLQQSGLEQEVERTVDTVQTEASDVARTPGNAQQDVERAVEQFLQTGRAADRENLVNIMVARTDMSRAEAQRTVEQYQSRYQQVRQRAGRALDSLQQTARQASGQATEALSTVGYASFFAMLVGALAAAAGGAMGTPKDLPAAADARRREDAR